MYMCVCITKQQQITSCMVEIQYLTAKVQKLLQWCSCFKTVISWRPLGRITWPRYRFVAKGLYSIWSHQSEVGFPRVVAGRFAPWFEVSYCNAFWSHCNSILPCEEIGRGSKGWERMGGRDDIEGSWFRSECIRATKDNSDDVGAWLSSQWSKAVRQAELVDWGMLTSKVNNR